MTKAFDSIKQGLQEAMAHAGPQYLDRDLAPGVGAPGAMDLRDRGGGDRLGVVGDVVPMPFPGIEVPLCGLQQDAGTIEPMRLTGGRR